MRPVIGSALSPNNQNVVICKNCGKLIKSSYSSCPYCGESVEAIVQFDGTTEIFEEKRKQEAIPCPICGSRRTKNSHCFDSSPCMVDQSVDVFSIAIAL